ncbi:MAG: penicillin-binding transpeptidase domain-containing protein [bacterium]
MKFRTARLLVVGLALSLGAPAFSQTPTQAVANAHTQASQTAEQTGVAAKSASARAQAVAQAALAFEPVTIPTGNKDWKRLGLDLKKAERVGDHLVQTLADGSKVTFTVDPDVQAALESMLDNYNVPHSGVVLIEPKTGRVRAFVSHTEGKPAVKDIAQKSLAPSASVFKVITAAALIETAGVDPAAQTCYHGGRSSLTPQNIKERQTTRHQMRDPWRGLGVVDQLDHGEVDLQTP